MFKSFLILFIFSSLFVSCLKKADNKETGTKKPQMSITKKHIPIKELNKTCEEEIKNWEEYNDLKIFLNRFTNISPNDALNNALELKMLSKKIKDSIRIDILKTSAFKARLNVFENETLRLADMTHIPAITSKDVNNQVKKIINTFNYINDKINDVYTQKLYNKSLNIDSLLLIEREK
ncbi:MAG: hypothetical protein KGV59_03235 [Tenacibaculum sp.]|nr:hypothetical protein [Tenacibaculum sp.]